MNRQIYPSLKPVRDLKFRADNEECNGSVWESTSDDPGFLIRLPALRPRFLMIRLHGGDKSVLSPQIYFDLGGGFSERNSLHVAQGRDFCLTLDVGRLGFTRSIRLDPASEPGTFTCEVSALGSERQVLEQERAWIKNFPDGHVERISEVGLLHNIGRWLSWASRQDALPAWLDRIHRLAEEVPSPPPPARDDGPWLSIVVPTYNTPVSYLDDLLTSFESQHMEGVELIFSDDASSSRSTLGWLRSKEGHGSLRVVINKVNGGIAATTNAGIGLARGTWVTLLDHDDVIAPSALKMARRTLLDNPQAKFLYTDEVVVDRGLRPRGLMAKPAYDPVLLSGVNYINHFSFYLRSRLHEIGRLRDGFQGSQDYDLLLRYLDSLDDQEVLHLPYPAYWWRRDGKSFSTRHLHQATDAARTALGEHFNRNGRQVEVGGAITPSLHRISFGLSKPAPRISVIIPSKNALELVTTIMRGLLDETEYPDLEILIIDNGTTDPRVLDFYEEITRTYANVHIHIREERFNFARAINRGFSLATGEHFLLLNNDISILHPDWLAEMVSCLNFEKAGIVGAKLLYPNGTIQHAGVIAGFGGLAGHWYLGKPADFGGPMNRLHVRASMTCVTAAVMLISGECRNAVGDMDEENFAVAYNDVDYCLRAYAEGFRTIWTPFAKLVHHESASRGSERKMEHRMRFEREKRNLRLIHQTGAFNDPASSPSYANDRSTPELKARLEAPEARYWFPSSSGLSRTGRPGRRW